MYRKLHTAPPVPRLLVRFKLMPEAQAVMKSTAQLTGTARSETTYMTGAINHAPTGSSLFLAKPYDDSTIVPLVR
jgi:hypothetical protein